MHILKSHASDNPLTCPLCGYVCKKPNGLSIHMKSHVQDIADLKVPIMKLNVKQERGISTTPTLLNLKKNEHFYSTLSIKPSPNKNENDLNVKTSKEEDPEQSKATLRHGAMTTKVSEDTSGELKKQKLVKHSSSPMRFKMQRKASLFMKKTVKTCDRNDLLVKQRKGIRMDKISCKYCGKKVIREVNKIHEHSMKCPNMEKTNKKSFMCCSCDYSSTYLGLLNTHILTVHSRIEDKPHKCDLCEFRTAYSQSLVIHFRTHTGEKPFECLSCDFKSTTSSSLKSHIKIHHEKRSPVEKLCKLAQSPLGDKQYACKYCAFKAKKFGTLNRHINSQHPQYKHLMDPDQDTRNISEMLQIEMNTESNTDSELNPNASYSSCSAEKTLFLQFLNLETRSSSKLSCEPKPEESVLDINRQTPGQQLGKMTDVSSAASSNQ
ncbi:zinc finger Y-chromosomal protein 1-like isoform X2 [Diaphorina citri]|uniref:Zinc finger Y-chromosomal protein 1-like isoform X1 n=1 Tax=Diaphorina citri TaxID=121845 RepID=A0A3Q0JGG5_DIACI|nr:zinc finger Y-chromosomal protein 1-like isoform X1 [Diaphorina citri]XP_026685780.1 zinc finger Y-chromosomal protein 1-like isoform X2 [Diaphorina citri]